MSAPKIIKDVREIRDTYVYPVEDATEESPNNLPIDADTLDGHPVDYFASKNYVSTTLYDYIRAVLGTTY